MLPKLSRFFVLLLLFFCQTVGATESMYNMPRGVTAVSHSIYNLHMTVFWICVGIGVVVFSFMFYAIIYHRKSQGAVAATFHEHPSLEIVWAIVPFVILVAMAIPATKVLMDMEDTSEADVTIKVTGYQWKWKYDYLDEGISFFSNLATPQEQIHEGVPKNKWYLLEVDHPVVVPINKKIRFLMTANDVIHSWWVPELGIKRDAIPGFIHETWARIEKPGTYRGQCAELCGVNHAYMPVVVKAVSEKDYGKWVEKTRGKKAKAAKEVAKVWTKSDLMKLGKQSYDKLCVACHKVDGTGQPPVFPAIKGSSISVGEPISRHIDIVLNGVSGTAMQAFAPQLSDAEIAAVVTYERNAFENNTGDVIQPSQISKARKK